MQVYFNSLAIKVNVNKMKVNGPTFVKLENHEGCRKWMPKIADRVDTGLDATKHSLPLVEFQTPVVKELVLMVPENQNHYVFLITRPN